MERTMVFSAVLVINIFSITDSADQNNIVRDIKQDAIIAHAQAIRGLGVMQVRDVAMQSVLQAFNLAKNLGAFARGQIVEVMQSGRAVFNLITLAVHRVASGFFQSHLQLKFTTSPVAASPPRSSCLDSTAGPRRVRRSPRQSVRARAICFARPARAPA